MKYIFHRRWNQSPANDGQSTCGAVNIQGKLADLSCNAREGYICQYQSPGHYFHFYLRIISLQYFTDQHIFVKYLLMKKYNVHLGVSLACCCRSTSKKLIEER